MFKNSYKDITSKIVEKKIGSKATNSVLFNSNVKLIRLTSEELTSVHKAFDDNKGVDDSMLKISLNEHILPRFKNELGWTNIRSIKCRANDRKTFEQRYNADCHRDRHLFGGTTGQRMNLSVQNYSAVIYLDKAVFRYFSNSSVTFGLEEDSLNLIRCVDVEIEPGMAVLFPSSLIHQARKSIEDPNSRRRTIVMFDIENPDNDKFRYMTNEVHNIVMCPKWTQWAFFHNFFNEDNLSNIAFKRLMCNHPYSWRYIVDNQKSKDRPYFIHWQITQNKYNKDKITEEQKFNRSIYLITPDEYPEHCKLIDHRNNILYIKNLLFYSIMEWPHTYGLAGQHMWGIFIVIVLGILLKTGSK